MNDNLPVVQFDNAAATTDKNLVAVRPHHPSPIDNTQAGIVNLGSRTAGVSVGATASYATIGGGDQNAATATGATVPGGTGNTASGANSLAEGSGNTASGTSAHAEGNGNTASGDFSHVEGNGNHATAPHSHAEGVTSTANGDSAHAEGVICTAHGVGSHAEGNECSANGNYSHAEGDSNTASGHASHTEGNQTSSGGDSSHAEGFETMAPGDYSHAQGVATKALRVGQSSGSSFGKAPLGSNKGAYQDGKVTYGVIGAINATPIDLLDVEGNAFELENDKTYGLKIRLVVVNQSGTDAAQIVHDVLIHTVGAVATMDADNLTLNQNTEGHAFSISLSSTPAFMHMTFTSASTDPTNAAVTVDWTEGPNSV